MCLLEVFELCSGQNEEGMGWYEILMVPFHRITIAALKCVILKWLGTKQTTFFSHWTQSTLSANNIIFRTFSNPVSVSHNNRGTLH